MNVSIEKRHAFLIFSVIIFLAGAIVVYANTFATEGHARGEIDWSGITGVCTSGQCISNINAEGQASCSACSGTGAGDITSVTAGSGLSGGGLSGDVSLRLSDSCSAGQILKSNGPNNWYCAADAGASISISAGSGISVSPSPITGTGTVSLTSSCSNGQILKYNGASWTCSADNTGGSLPASISCPVGQAVVAYSSSTNTFTCDIIIPEQPAGAWYPVSVVGSINCVTHCNSIGKISLAQPGTDYVCKGGVALVSSNTVSFSNPKYYCCPTGCITPGYELAQCYCG